MAKESQKKSGRLFTAVGVALCVIFGLMLIFNVTIIAQGAFKKDSPPSIFGITPLVTLSGSMSGDREGHIEKGDLIFLKKVKTSSLKVGDVISFFDKSASSDKRSVITHRIVEIANEDGELVFYTQGDYNVDVQKDTSKDRVPEKNVIGVLWFRVPKAGHFAIFLQKPVGMAIFMGIPICTYIIFDLIRRKRVKEDNELKDVLFEAEIARIKAKKTFSVEDEEEEIKSSN